MLDAARASKKTVEIKKNLALKLFALKENGDNEPFSSFRAERFNSETRLGGGEFCLVVGPFGEFSNQIDFC